MQCCISNIYRGTALNQAAKEANVQIPFDSIVSVFYFWSYILYSQRVVYTLFNVHSDEDITVLFSQLITILGITGRSLTAL